MFEKIQQLNEQFSHLTAQEILEYFLNAYKGKIALSSSFGAEDQVLTHMILTIDKTAKIFTLDTGRLPYETYSVMDNTNLKYGIKVDVYFPEAKEVEELYKTQGINGFYESIENRKRCCFVRKIQPLQRALKGLEVWITGLRSAQSVTREQMQLVEYDEANGVIKLNPLLAWSEQDVWDFIKENKVPYNKLHDQGYPSIGCAPCTRAVKEGEDIRSGRWWWENPEHKECGLHKK
jgi:phosphoadenosine phosphosulfate reductase